jgi:hypothetical protein
MNVYFDDSIWQNGKGRRGHRQAVGWSFEYAGMRCVIPAVYRFPKGIVFDILSFADGDALREYFKRYEHEQSLSSAQRRCAEQEHPFQPVNIQEAWLDGTPVQGNVSYSHSIYVPWAGKDEGLQPLRRAYRRYLGAQPFACQRVRVEYPESCGFEALRRRLLPGLINYMRLAVSAIERFYPLDIRFELPAGSAGTQVEFSDPVTKRPHTLYFGKTETTEFPLMSGMSRSLYATLAAYELEPELPKGVSLVFDSSISASSTEEMRLADKEPGGAAAIGIIGGADGPTAIFVGTKEECRPKGPHGLPLHTCFSMPSFTESDTHTFRLEGLSAPHIGKTVITLGNTQAEAEKQNSR